VWKVSEVVITVRMFNYMLFVLIFEYEVAGARELLNVAITIPLLRIRFLLAVNVPCYSYTSLALHMVSHITPDVLLSLLMISSFVVPLSHMQ